MADIKRQDITLSDRTKGISADEFAWGSYFYSEWISSGYNTKWFELWYKLGETAINSRNNWYAMALEPSVYWFMAFTRDWRLETEQIWNGTSPNTWDSNGWWAIYSFNKVWSVDTGYVNWLMYNNLAIAIRETSVDVINYRNTYNPASEILSHPKLSDNSWWTVWTWWAITDSWAVHTAWNTATLTADISWASLTTSNYCRCAVKISNRTEWAITVTIGNNNDTFDTGVDGWYVTNLRWAGTTTTLTITPNSSFNWTVEIVNLHKYNTSYVNNYSLYWNTANRPAVIWEWDLYIGSINQINIVNLSDRWVTSKALIDSNYRIVAITQQAWNLIIWATDWYNSRQYYWNWVDAVATEVIEWKWLIIQDVAWTEIISYVLTTSWATSWVVEWYEYRLYAVNGYQRNLIASKLYQNRSGDYLESPHYNENKKFDFNDVTRDRCMTIFLDSLYIPWCDWIYKYGNDIPWINKAWTRPIKYTTWSTNITTWQRWHFLGVGYRASGTNYIWSVDNRLYNSKWFIVTESIYWDKLSTRKAIEKFKIWYKNLASTVGWIKVYIIVDDTYFWRFRPTVTPTKRPSIWDVYNVANNTTATVIDVDETNGVITFVTKTNTGSYPWVANTSLTKVSWNGDNTITVGYNYDNMCLIKTIESDNQEYNSDFIFWKDFTNNNIPYRHKMQLVIELNSNNQNLSPEIYEISMVSDITDTVL